MRRITDFFEIKNKAVLFESVIGGDVIYIKKGNERTKVKLHEIRSLEALKDYTLKKNQRLVQRNSSRN